ncbi:MAG: hypothetical protein K2W96_07105 [Gemmataceae bacterium]|nr:hypothetical protein [Gemmataceae bacterium]
MRTLLLLAVLAAGCQKARPYDPRPEPREGGPPGEPMKEKPFQPLPEWVDWQNPGRDPDKDETRIEFVHPSSKDWAGLKSFWNEPATAKKGERPPPVRIKVPLGLDDPTGYIPAHSTPTLKKWELGRRLFFEESLLEAEGKVSCAGCHRPADHFADGRRAPTGFYNTPSLVNSVYNSSQFWNGRATYLEEVVQQKPEDERTPLGREFRHAWPGVIARLRASGPYREAFGKAFGLMPDQTTVGQALATYMRTLLAADSLHDRAVRQQMESRSPALEAKHYEAVLDQAALNKLDRPTAARAVVAADLVRGYRAFAGEAGCAACHPAANGVFTDKRFHNIGVDADADQFKGAPAKLGRFAVAPLGEKNRFLRAAFKTPSLRGLLRTGPYFHTGEETTLLGAVRRHAYDRHEDEWQRNPFLDRLLTDEFGVRKKFAAAGDLDALVLFLKALDGEEADASVRAPLPEAKKP